MKKFIIAYLMGLFMTAGFEVNSTPLAPLEGGVASLELFDIVPEAIAADAVYVAPAPVAFKVAIYSVPLPNENKIVLVKDPKGFVERAIRHNMEYLAIKPGEKGEYWELMPVFANEPNSLSFDIKKTPDEGTAEAQDEVLRIVPVKDFIRYN